MDYLVRNLSWPAQYSCHISLIRKRWKTSIRKPTENQKIAGSPPNLFPCLWRAITWCSWAGAKIKCFHHFSDRCHRSNSISTLARCLRRGIKIINSHRSRVLSHELHVSALACVYNLMWCTKLLSQDRLTLLGIPYRNYKSINRKI